jgi:hypothetical protein
MNTHAHTHKVQEAEMGMLVEAEEVGEADAIEDF